MKTLIACAAVLTVVPGLFAAEGPLLWPQFRGPQATGIAAAQKPPVQLGPEINVRWKVSVPSGLSSPIVAGDNLVITAFEQGKLYTIAYDRTSGNEAWRAEAPAQQLEAFHPIEGSPASSTPVTDGKRIVSYFGSCGLFCYDLSGNEIWRHELPPAVTPGAFGSGVSPIIAEGIVVLVRDEVGDPKIIALDVETGRLRWETKRQSVASYATPVRWRTASGQQIVAAGHARMVGYDLSSGAEEWFVTEVPSGCCTSPTVADGTLYFAGWSPGGSDDEQSQMPAFKDLLKDLDADDDQQLSRSEAEKKFEGFFDSQDTNKDGFISRDEYEAILKFMSEGQNAAFAIQAGGSGDITDSHLLWKQTRGLPYVSSAIVYEGQLVMVKDGGIVTAYDKKSGEHLYTKRVAASGRYYASPTAADGRIYLVSFDDGVVTVLQAGSNNGAVMAKSPSLGERVAATPAIADDTLYVRTEKHLYAFRETD